MPSPLQAQILNAINSIRPYLYGTGFKIQLVRFNGTDKQYDFLADVENDFIVSFDSSGNYLSRNDRSGNMTLRLMTNELDAEMRKVTHLVFDGWLYQVTEPATPPQGPFPMWKVTGRPLGQRYIAEP